MSHAHMPPTKLTVSLAERSYPIIIGASLLNSCAIICEYLPQLRVALITNETIWPLYGKQLVGSLQRENIIVHPVVLPDGETHKDWASLNTIFDALLEHACDRKTTLIALGGGVVGDIVGFASATYQRGVPFIQIPTTLLAQVDSSVGGKTAINHPRGKNMIGAFYQPQLVLADTDTLNTLPEREFRSGLAEVIKYGLILDRNFFEWLDTNLAALLARDTVALTYAIKRSCEIKAAVVAADERETAKEGGRALLNLGHTFGHAIETELGYGAWLHGEAVACGMVQAARLSHALGLIDAATVARTQDILARALLPIELPNVSTEAMLEHMGRDKKNDAGVIKLILMRGIGDAYVESSIAAARIETFLNTQPRCQQTTL
jgi:3-dehydroquinate synthase